MKKKQFAVKLQFELGFSFVSTTCAKNKKLAIQNVLDEYNLTHNEHFTLNDISDSRVQEIPICIITTAFGPISVNVRPNPYYATEVIINGKRITLPNEFNYWDIKSITIHNAGFPVIATIETKSHKFIVKNNTNGYNCCFEIMK